MKNTFRIVCFLAVALCAGRGFAADATSSALAVIDVTVYLEVPPPTIAHSPAAFVYECREGDSSTDTLLVWNDGDGTLDYTIETAPAGLLHVEPPGGVTTGPVRSHTVSFDTSGLPAGDHAGTVTITDSAATNDPVRIPASVRVCVALIAGDGIGFPGASRYPVDIGLNNTATTIGSVLLELSDTPDWLTIDEVVVTDRCQGFVADWTDTGATPTITLDPLAGAVITPGAGPIATVLYNVDPAAPVGTTVTLGVAATYVTNEASQPLPVLSQNGRFQIRSTPQPASIRSWTLYR